MRNLSIGLRLMFAFAVLTASLVGVGVFGLTQLNAMKAGLDEVGPTAGGARRSACAG